MKAHLIKAANEVILDQKMLVNVISQRVRQLAFGHRPLVACAPGTGLADVALTEVIEGKLSFEAIVAPPLEEVATVVAFPDQDCPAQEGGVGRRLLLRVHREVFVFQLLRDALRSFRLDFFGRCA